MDVLKDPIVLLQIYQSALFALLAFAFSFREGNYSKKFLGWFLVLCTVFALYKGAYTPGLYHLFWFIFPLGIPIFLSFFPAFYFYIKSLIIRDYHFSKKEYLHLLPAMLLFLLSAPYYFLTWDNQESFASTGTGLFDNPLLTFLKYAYYFCVYGYFNVQMVLYSWKIFNLYTRHRANIETAFSYKNSIKLSWVIILTLMIVVFLILLDLSYLVGFRLHGTSHIWTDLMVGLIILFISIFGILQRDIYIHHEAAVNEPDAVVEATSTVMIQETVNRDAGNPEPMSPASDATPNAEPFNEEKLRVKKYAGSGLTEQQKMLLKAKLDTLMEEKIYLNTKLTLDDVAEQSGTNSKYLSQVINESQQQNFYTYINSFRIQEALRLLDDRQHQKYSIHGIAKMVGFASKSSFNEAFRRIVGMTPSEYLERK